MAGARDRRRREDSCTASTLPPAYFIFPEIPLDARRGARQYISMKVETAASQLEALGNVTRLELYRILVRAGDAGLPVGRIQQRLGIAASTLSHHLRKLVEVGLVTQERERTTLICRANYPGMNALIGYLADECCADAGCGAGCADEAA